MSQILQDDDNDNAKAIAIPWVFSKNSWEEKLWERGDNSGNQHFLLFPQCFVPIQEQKYGKLAFNSSL